MIRIAGWRALVGHGGQAAAGRAGTESGKGGRQDKRPCHECRKSLTGLADSRAGRSVGCRVSEIPVRFQRPAMHSVAKQPLKAAP
jgi:hypothetical protein